MYATGKQTLYVSLYTDSRATTNAGGAEVTVVQWTNHPWDGNVKITVGLSEPSNWTLALRIPGWSQGVEVRINGKPVTGEVRNGLLLIKRRWANRDRVQLVLPMRVMQIASHPRARQTAGQVALQRGPVIYCLEEVDNGRDLANIYVRKDTSFRVATGPGGLGEVPVLTATASAADANEWKGELYAERSQRMVKRAIKAVPYFPWANRATRRTLARYLPGGTPFQPRV